MIDLHDNVSVHRFDHEAMNTIFSIRIRHPDRERALRAAGACFRKLDLLEDSLSRYRENSDVTRINTMQAEESLFIDEETYECLRLAMEAFAATGGLFDVTLGARIEHQKGNVPGDSPELSGKIHLDPDRPRVVCSEPGRQIDLGGIGKGFALDRMAAVLREYQVTSALLSCAGSTLLAMGPDSWPVALRGDCGQLELELHNEALSASGTGFQGAHVLHPGETIPNYRFRRIWIVGERAATADAFSTACLIMDENQLRDFRSIAGTVKHCYAEAASGENEEILSL